MANTYTSPYGGTSFGTSLSNMTNVLNSLRGKINPAAVDAMTGYLGATQQAQDLESGMPQKILDFQQQAQDQSQQGPMTDKYGQMSDTYKMFLADHQLAQKYTAPSAQQSAPQITQPQATPPSGALQTSLDNVYKPFQGFTNPYNASVAENSQLGGIEKLMGSLGDLVKFNKSQANDAYSKNVDAYKAYVQGVSNQASAKGQAVSSVLGALGQLGLLTGPNGMPLNATESEKKQYYADQLKQDSAKKMTLTSLMSKYGGYLSADEIFQLYNATSPWGPAKETRDKLGSMGVSKSILDTYAPAQTAEMQNKKEALKPAFAQLAQVDPNVLKSLGPLNKSAKWLIENVGGAGVDPKILNANTQFETLKQTVVRVLQGARMSDMDIKNAVNYIPNIVDTEQSARIKLANLDKLLQSLQGNVNGTSRFDVGTSGAPANNKSSGKYTIMEVK